MLLDCWLQLYSVFSECCYIIQAKTIHFWLWLYCVFHWYYLCQSGQNCIHFGCDCIVYQVSTIYIIQAKTVFILAVTVLCILSVLFTSFRPKQYLFWLDCIVYFVSTIYIIQAKTIHFCLRMYCLFCWYYLHHSGQNCIHFCLRMYCVFCWYYLHHSGPNYPFLAVMSSFLFKAFCYKCY